MTCTVKLIGNVNYLTDDETAGLTEILSGDRTLGQAGEYWARRVGFEVTYNR